MRLKTRILIITGIIIALVPYLGIPIFWKRVLLSLAGILVIAIAILLRIMMQTLREKFRSIRPEQAQQQPETNTTYETTS